MIPNPLLVSEGRANPRGIAYLYLSTDEETAMSEVRPWIGSILSLALFTIAQDLKIVNFSKSHGQRPALLETIIGEPVKQEISVKQVWQDIDNAFSAPVSKDEDATAYVPTQIIAEFIRNRGFDGIAYKSTLTESGHNIVLFDPTTAHLRHCRLCQATTMKIAFEDVPGIETDYWKPEKGT
jgi:RES domain